MPKIKESLIQVSEDEINKEDGKIFIKCQRDKCPFGHRLEDIDEDVLVNRTFLENLTKVQIDHMSAISENTKNIHTSIEKFAEENKNLVGIIAGKKQVPMSIFLMCLLSVCIGCIILIAAYSQMQLVMDSNKLELKQSVSVDRNGSGISNNGNSIEGVRKMIQDHISQEEKSNVSK